MLNLQVINAFIKENTSSDVELRSQINHSQKFLPAFQHTALHCSEISLFFS